MIIVDVQGKLPESVDRSIREFIKKPFQRYEVFISVLANFENGHKKSEIELGLNNNRMGS